MFADRKGWSEQEEALLDEGLMFAARICDSREKWLAVEQHVGSRDAAACEERFRARRAEAIVDEEKEEDVEQFDAGHVQPGGSSGSGGVGGRKDCDASGWWSQGWQQGGKGRSDHKGRGRQSANSWWESGGWKTGEWDASGAHDASNQSSQTWEDEQVEDLSGLDEGERRALEMRRQVEANRVRLQQREAQNDKEKQQREKKQQEERELREKERRDYLEGQERKLQEKLEQERQKKEQEELRQRASQRQAEQYNPGLAPMRTNGGRAVQKGGWAAKAAAGQKGQQLRQKKQEELDRQTAEVLANIAVATGKQKPSGDLVADEGTDNSNEENCPATSSSTVPRHVEAAVDSAATKGKGASLGKGKSEKGNGKGETGRQNKKRWWARIDGDCPISLAPIAELPRPPFGLEAEGSSTVHYYDARFLASFLLSSCDFIDPANRRALTHEECESLDSHLARHHPEVATEASVADAFALFEKHGVDGDSPVHAVQREATAVLQHLFRFGSSRRTDQRGRAIAYADGGLTVIDDDDVLTRSSPPPASGSTGGNARGATALSTGVNLERTTSVDFPHLADGGGAAVQANALTGNWVSRGGGNKGSGKGNQNYPSLPCAKAAAPKAWGPKTAAATTTAAKAKAGSARGRGGKGR